MKGVISIYMKAVIYARYSSHNQREESIESQLRVCHEYAAREGLDVIREYTDSALSGTSDQRPAFQQLIADSSRKEFDTVLIYAYDRFARDRYDAAVYRKKLGDNGARIIAVTQPIDDSPEGVLLESLLEGLAEYYSKNLARGVKRGMRENALKCMSVGGPTPIGYKIDPNTKKYVIDESAAAIVREIFGMYVNGSGIEDILRTCEAKGYRLNSGKHFTRNGISKMLRNRKYTGVYIYEDIIIEGGMPVIIDPATFDKAQEIISMGKRTTPRKSEEVNYILTGKLFCGHCGKPMVGTSGTGKSGKVHHYYHCRNHGNKCIKHAERKESLEDFIIDYIVNHFLTYDNVSAIAERIIDMMSHDDFARAMQRTQDQIDDVDHRIANLMKALESADEAASIVMARIEELQKEKATLQKDLETQQAENLSFLTKELIMAWMLSFAERNDGSLEFKRDLVTTFVNAIYIYDTDEDDPNDKGRKKRKIVLAFNSSGPESKVTLECADECFAGGSYKRHYGPPNENCSNTDIYIVSRGKVIIVILDY